MKRLLLITIVAVLLCGCNVSQQAELKIALGDALTIGAEVEKIEREQGDIDTADRITTWIERGQKIYDTGDYGNECSWIMEVATISYDWVSEKYPDKPYRIYLALLKVKLAGYCGEVVK